MNLHKVINDTEKELKDLCDKRFCSFKIMRRLIMFKIQLLALDRYLTYLTRHVKGIKYVDIIVSIYDRKFQIKTRKKFIQMYRICSKHLINMSYWFLSAGDKKTLKYIKEETNAKEYELELTAKLPQEIQFILFYLDHNKFFKI